MTPGNELKCAKTAQASACGSRTSVIEGREHGALDDAEPASAPRSMRDRLGRSTYDARRPGRRARTLAARFAARRGFSSVRLAHPRRGQRSGRDDDPHGRGHVARERLDGLAEPSVPLPAFSARSASRVAPVGPALSTCCAMDAAAPEPPDRVAGPNLVGAQTGADGSRHFPAPALRQLPAGAGHHGARHRRGVPRWPGGALCGRPRNSVTGVCRGRCSRRLDLDHCAAGNVDAASSLEDSVPEARLSFSVWSSAERTV
jgi:hypothetical protein